VQLTKAAAEAKPAPTCVRNVPGVGQCHRDAGHACASFDEA